MGMRKLLWGVVWALATFWGQTAMGDEARFAYVFGDNMVLQQGQAVPVWGFAAPGTKVTVTFAGQTLTGEADKDGRWQVRLAPMTASAQGREMVLNGTQGQILKNVVVGEVWLCGGQSNMEWTVYNCLDFAQTQKNANNPLIRHVKIDKVAANEPSQDFAKPQVWQVCSPDTVGNFSGAGYFFADRLAKELQVPVGLIGANWGGIKIESWIPPSGYATVKELHKFSQDLQKWANKEAPMPQSNDTPTRLYNAMLAPLMPYAIKGAIFYHGESNWGEHVSYFQKLTALVNGWRGAWGQGDFPFIIAQLTAFKADANNPKGGEWDGWSRQREAQAQCARTLAHAGLIVTIDIGDANNIHPKNKQDVGDRFARQALALAYGKDIVPCGPVYKSHKVEGDKIRLEFDHVGAGLMVGRKEGLQPTVEDKKGKLQRFAISHDGKKWVWAEAVIDGNAVVVSSPEVPNPTAVRYAFSMNPTGANLYNRDGLPCCPFRTDKWDW